MAEEYKGSIELISGIRPVEGGIYPLVNAKDVQVALEDDRLDVIIEKLKQQVIESKTAIFG